MEKIGKAHPEAHHQVPAQAHPGSLHSLSLSHVARSTSQEFQSQEDLGKQQTALLRKVHLLNSSDMLFNHREKTIESRQGGGEGGEKGGRWGGG